MEFMTERYLEHKLYSSGYSVMSDPYMRDHLTLVQVDALVPVHSCQKIHLQVPLQVYCRPLSFPPRL